MLPNILFIYTGLTWLLKISPGIKPLGAQSDFLLVFIALAVRLGRLTGATAESFFP